MVLFGFLVKTYVLNDGDVVSVFSLMLGRVGVFARYRVRRRKNKNHIEES